MIMVLSPSTVVTDTILSAKYKWELLVLARHTFMYGLHMDFFMEEILFDITLWNIMKNDFKSYYEKFYLQSFGK